MHWSIFLTRISYVLRIFIEQHLHTMNIHEFKSLTNSPQRFELKEKTHHHYPMSIFESDCIEHFTFCDLFCRLVNGRNKVARGSAKFQDEARWRGQLPVETDNIARYPTWHFSRTGHPIPNHPNNALCGRTKDSVGNSQKIDSSFICFIAPNNYKSIFSPMNYKIVSFFESHRSSVDIVSMAAAFPQNSQRQVTAREHSSAHVWTKKTHSIDWQAGVRHVFVSHSAVTHFPFRFILRWVWRSHTRAASASRKM